MMNTYEEELRQKWDSINYHDGGSLQLSLNHPLKWYVRYAAKEYKSLVIVSDNPIDNISSSKSIEAACNIRKDGKYAVSFTLVNSEQEDVFISMSSDIIEYSRAGQKPIDSLKLVMRRYAAWMKLLDHKRTALLSVNAQKGLLAELLFLKNRIESGMQPLSAIVGWVGPDGDDQDFVYNNGWYEIKATGASSSQITISSVEQLDNPAEGELVVYRIDKCAPERVGATTLYNTVHLLLDMLTCSSAALNDFVLKLGSAGYIDMEEYDKQCFVVSSFCHYTVDTRFPRIVRKDLPEEIVNAEYQLDLPSISNWKK